jgi:hypothetical protein
MPDTPPRIPRPVPFNEMPPPAQPPPGAAAPSEPATLRIVTIAITGTPEISVVYKRTYRWAPGRPGSPTDEQPPLVECNVTHDKIAPGIAPSFKILCEVVGFKTGTDVVIHAEARTRRPVVQTKVRASVPGLPAHEADVTGNRRCDYVGDKLVFTPPEPFDRMALRYENAYGGCDAPFEADLRKRLRENPPEQDIRRARPAMAEILAKGNPLAYPRNRFGKGYVLDNVRDLIAGRELPNLEWPKDRLTPERLVVGTPFAWNKQPLPVGFGYLSPGMFPRSAMFGLPPAARQTPETFVEVARGLIPQDFCRGNLITAEPKDLPNLIHPSAGRCASLGLWAPFLKGNETIMLEGMDAEHLRLPVVLPGERPCFTVGGLQPRPVELDAQLYLVHVDLLARQIALIWTAHTAMPRAMQPDDLLNLESGVKIRMVGV